MIYNIYLQIKSIELCQIRYKSFSHVALYDV